MTMSDISDATVELAIFFPGAEKFESDVITELASICRMHELTVEDMFYKWESHCMKMQWESANVTLETVRLFKQAVQDQLEKTMRIQSAAPAVRRTTIGSGAVGTPRASVKTEDYMGMLDGLISIPGSGKFNKISAQKSQIGTPTTTRIKMEPQDSSGGLDGPSSFTPSRFSDRQKPGDIIEIFDNLSLPEAEYPIMPFPESRVKLAASSDQKKMTYKPLAMKLSEVSEILDDHIDDFMILVSEHHKLDLSLFGSPASQSTTEIIAVGRICNDSLEGRLNAASVVMETSRRMGNALRIPLNTSKLKGFAFFPGQIVAARGTNTSGNEFVINEILELPQLASAASTTESLIVHRQRLRGDSEVMDADDDPLPLNMILGAGPYTTDNNLEFEALRELCKVAGDKMVDVMVLTGPFIDIDHPMIVNGDFDLPEGANYDPDTTTLSTAFKYMISPHFAHLCTVNPQITIIFIPHIRDAVNKHVSWPQDSFARKELGLPRNVRILTNPMTLSINEVVFGLSSQDILFELRREELVGGRPSDPQSISRLCRHLLEQRHYFPLFPPTDRSMLMKVGSSDGRPQGASLDMAYLKLGEIINAKPDVMLLPSNLPPFIKVVESVLMINPGTLSRRSGAGTYARMTIYSPKIEEGISMQPHNVFERSRVEIVRI